MRRIAVAIGMILAVSSPAWAQEQLARALTRMPPVFGTSVEYQRRGKESIYGIARRFGVSANAVHNANEGGLTAGDERLVIPRERIAPLPSADGIVVNLPERNIYFYRDGKPVKCYPIAIGMRGWQTPTGNFRIVNKRKNPTWFPPKWAIQEEPVPPGPHNPLGDRWMGLSAPGYGIHATNAPASIGRYVSHGCMRMYPEQAHELYSLSPVGTPVKIVYERAVLGYRPEDGIVYLAYHPDPYQAGDVTPDDVREMLKDYGLDKVADLVRVAEILKRTSGVPTPVVGSRVKVDVNGKRVKFALAPTPVGLDWLVPAGPLAVAMGAETQTGPGVNYVTIRRGAQRVFMSPGSPDALINGAMAQLDVVPQLAAQYPLVPLRATVEALGASVVWDDRTETLSVWDGLGRAFGSL